jgi:leader peptidase (prepilin peptidase)/N-methyltransferase
MLSFLAQRCKCRYCGEPVSWRYFTVELLTGVYFAFLYYAIGYDLLTFLALALFGAALIAIFFIDLDHWIIPDQLSVFGILIGVTHEVIGLALRREGYEAFRIPFPGLANGVPMLQSIMGMAVSGGIFLAIAVLSYYVFKKEGLGGGDVKLAAAIGANLALSHALLSFFLAVALGSIIGIGLIVVGSKTRKDYVPFGPMMVAGAMIAIFYGTQLIETWRSYVGLS